MKNAHFYIAVFVADEPTLGKIMDILNTHQIKISEIYSPMPLSENLKYLPESRNRIGWIAVIGGIIGCLAGFFIQKYISITAYPLNYGGKPLLAIPSFVPVMIESTFLFAALAIAIAFLCRTELGFGSRKNIIHRKITDDHFAILIDNAASNMPYTYNRVCDLIKPVTVIKPQLVIL